MKKNIIAKRLAILIAVVLGATSCNLNEKLEEDFYNKDRVTTPEIEMLFAGTMQQAHLFRMSYGPSYHYIRGFTKTLGLGINQGLVFSENTSNQPQKTWTGWSGEPFNYDIFTLTAVDFAKNINLMNRVYASLSDAEKDKYKVYVNLANIVMSYAAARSADCYDDIPYFSASGAADGNYYAKFDDQKVIYFDILDKLANCVKELKKIPAMTPEQQARFRAADILNGGNVEKWIKFANSLRLKLAIRISNVELEKSKSIIKDLLDNNEPLVLNSEDNIEFVERNKTLVSAEGDGVLFPRAFQERGYDLSAPRFWIEDLFNYKGVSNGEVDPRLYVIFQPNKDGKYVGLSEKIDDKDYLNAHYTAKEIEDIKEYNDLSNSPWDLTRLTSAYNRVTFLNYDLPYPIMHSTEVRLLLAEAAIRWPEIVKRDASEDLKVAIRSSIDYYYNLNSTNSYSESTVPALRFIMPGSKMNKPDESKVTSFMNYEVAKFNAMDSKDKVRHIFYQKMVHLNILNPYEIWAEARRLMRDYGYLPKSVSNVYWIERFFYPPSEANKNAENFKKVAAKNNYSTPVWWSGRTSAALNPNWTVK